MKLENLRHRMVNESEIGVPKRESPPESLQKPAGDQKGDKEEPLLASSYQLI